MARFVLAWFVLTLGVAVASPVVQPHTMTMICSEGGSKMIMVDADGKAVTGTGHTLDCPFCLPATPPPDVVSLQVPAAPPGACAVHPFASADLAALTGAPLPARGPPQSA
ncbi:DUF2946 family protein [Massilia sp.]|uniref:DUF2946 family protein n=1 Tax=Massilia sp. TaxID=1882437 RepID=UPI003917448C